MFDRSEEDIFKNPAILIVPIGVLFLWKRVGLRLMYFIWNHLLVTIFGIVGMVGLLVLYRALSTKKEITHGSADWLSFFEIRKIVNKKNHGYVIDGVGRISHELSTRNLITVAPTGAGKTWGQIIPNILNQENYSIVVTDPSGEVFKTTAAAAKAAGINVLVFRPFQPADTMFYNPIQHVANLSDAKMIAEAVMMQQDTADKFWVMAPAMLISALISFLGDLSEKTAINQRNMANILHLLAMPFDDLNQLMSQFQSEATRIEYASFMNAGDKTRPGILASALSALSLFTDHNVKESTQHHSIDFSELRAKKSILYLVIPEDKMHYASVLSALFYKHLLSHLFSEIKGYPVYLLLDEFGNMKIPDFETIITQSRKKNISISVMLQSIEQLRDKYKSAATTISEGGCQTKIFYSGMGLQSCKLLSESIGNKTEKILNKDSSKNPTYVQRPLITADEIRTMPKDQIIVITENKLPMRLTIKQGYTQKKIQKVLKEYSGKEVAINNASIIKTTILEAKP